MTDRKKELRRFLTRLFGDELEGYIEVRCIHNDTESDNKTSQRYFGSVDEVVSEFQVLDDFNKAGYHIYFGVNPRAEKKGNKQAVKQVVTCHADLDAKDFDRMNIVNGKKIIWKRIEALEDPPTIIVSSGNGYHLYWTLKEPFDTDTATAVNEVESINKRLGGVLGGDTVQDISRILRLPGFDNVKGEPVAVKWKIHKDSDYDLLDFDALPAQEQAEEPTKPNGTIPDAVSDKWRSVIESGEIGSHKSRSERDASVISHLIQAGLTDAEVQQIFDHYPVGAKHREARGTQYLDHTIKNMREHIQVEAAKKAPPKEDDTPPNLTALSKTWREVIEMELPEDDEIIGKGLLPKKTIMMIGGQPKVGKSNLMLNIAFYITGGKKWFDFPIEENGEVGIIEAEGNENNLYKRIKTLSEAPNEFHSLDGMRYVYTSDLKLSRENHRLELSRFVSENDLDVVVIDPLAQFHWMDENDNREMSQLFNHFRSIVDTYDVAMIVVHHTRKPGLHEPGGGVSLRGASAIFAAVDTVITIKEEKMTGIEKEATLSFDLKHGPPQDDIPVILDALWWVGSGKSALSAKEFVKHEIVKSKEAGIQRIELIEAGKQLDYKERTLSAHIGELKKDTNFVVNTSYGETRLWWHRYYPQENIDIS